MARATISPIQVNERNTASTAVLNTALVTAVDATDGAEITWSERDDKYIVMVQNGATSAKTVTFKAGDGLHGVMDLTVSVAASSSIILSLDSARFKVLSGTDKGKVLVVGESADIKLAVFCAP